MLNNRVKVKVLSEWLATTLPQRVHVNTISHGGVFRNQPEIFVERYKFIANLACMVTEEEFSCAITYLACDLSPYVPDQNLAVDSRWGT